MFETAQERVILLKTGLSGKEIERLYIEKNNFKIIRTPILYEANKFEFARSIFENNRKTKAIPVSGFVVLVLALFYPISTLFIALVLMVFVPPIFASVIILNEGKSILSNELKTMKTNKTVNF